MRIKVMSFEKLPKFMTIWLRKFNKKFTFFFKSQKKCNSRKKQQTNESQSGILQRRIQLRKLRKRWRMLNEKFVSNFKQSSMYFSIKVIKLTKKSTESKNAIVKRSIRFKNVQKLSWFCHLIPLLKIWS